MFFRRSVLNFKEFTCKFNGNCDTTKGKNCRACRFNACVLAQLDISLIQFPVDYDVGALKRRLEEKRQTLLLKKGQNVQQHQQQEDGSAAAALPMESLVEKFQSFATIMELVEFNKCLEHLLLAERQATKLRHSPNNLILEYLCGKSLADILASQMNVLNFVELFTMVMMNGIVVNYSIAVLEWLSTENPRGNGHGGCWDALHRQLPESGRSSQH